MCPACIAATVLTVVGTGSAGGLVALVAKLLRLDRGTRHDNEHARFRESRRGANGWPRVKPKGRNEQTIFDWIRRHEYRSP